MPGKRARRHFSQLSEFERGLIIGMKTAGWSTRRVAGQVDRSECAVRNCWEQWTREGTHARKTGSGATRKTRRREDRRIVRQALVDPTVTRSTIRADVDVAIVPQTISRHLAEANLKFKRPCRALPSTPEHRQLRLQWCQARSMWNVTDWQNVVFSNEYRFVLGTADNHVRVWRHPVQDLWFQQDGATCHTARATIDLLKDTFGDRLISRFGPVNWPPRSCDLTMLDYFLWGYVKSLVYADKPQTLDHLKDNIHPVIADIRPQMLEKVIENWTSRLDYIRASRGSPMPEIILKIESGGGKLSYSNLDSDDDISLSESDCEESEERADAEARPAVAMTDSLPSGCRQSARLENSLLMPHSQSEVVECLDTLCIESGLLGLPPATGDRIFGIYRTNLRWPIGTGHEFKAGTRIDNSSRSTTKYPLYRWAGVP
ncbi:transposable element Tcb1 transposase [Trichonephila clavipes]|nr:transposable element Tcb1 transposase [Trichonephila clavipes]